MSTSDIHDSGGTSNVPDSSVQDSGSTSNIPDSSVEESRTEQEPSTLHPPSSSPTASPTVLGASSTPSSNHSAINNTQKDYRQIKLELLRTREQRLNEWEEDVKQERRRLRMNGLWGGKLRAFVGKEIMEIAMYKRDVKEMIKDLEDEIKGI